MTASCAYTAIDQLTDLAAKINVLAAQTANEEGRRGNTDTVTPVTARPGDNDDAADDRSRLKH